MNQNTHITEQQLQILKSFACERLTNNSDNKALIEAFSCKRGTGLLNYLKQNGWQYDEQGIEAFYFIKTPDGKPCVFFSLKCGELFEPLDEASVQKDCNKALEILHTLHELPEGDPDHDKLLQELADYGNKINVPLEAVVNLVTNNAKSNVKLHKNTLYLLHNDKQREGDRPIQRVIKTYPGVEITNFCADDSESIKEYWKSLGFRFTIGEVMFWLYIAPKFIELQNIVGCKYAYLFAADKTPDGNLTNYYAVSLNFSKDRNLGTSKPRYDLCCEFMSQDVSDLKKRMDSFWDNFNLDPNDSIV